MLETVSPTLTFGGMVDAVGWRCYHFQSQTIGPLEGVTVPNEESAGFLVLQESNGCSERGKEREKF